MDIGILGVTECQSYNLEDLKPGGRCVWPYWPSSSPCTSLMGTSVLGVSVVVHYNHSDGTGTHISSQIALMNTRTMIVHGVPSRMQGDG